MAAFHLTAEHVDCFCCDPNVFGNVCSLWLLSRYFRTPCYVRIDLVDRPTVNDRGLSVVVVALEGVYNASRGRQPLTLELSLPRQPRPGMGLIGTGLALFSVSG